jgi:hypothetical protein
LLFFPAVQNDYRAAMKYLSILIAVITAAGARADLVLQQQITTPDGQAVATMKIKGAKMRMDLNAGQPVSQSIITDLNTGEVITLLHSEKLYSKTTGGPVKRAKAAGAASQAPVARPTGQTQKVGDYDTELYTWSNVRGITGTAWVAKNFPDYARIRADLAVLDKTAGADSGATPELSTLPGMVVRSQVAGGGQTIIMALISARETTLDASIFGIPRDYKELPKVKPVTPVAAPVQPKTSSAPPKAAASSRTLPANNYAAPGPKPYVSPRPAPAAKGTNTSKAAPGNFSTQKAPEW